MNRQGMLFDDDYVSHKSFVHFLENISVDMNLLFRYRENVLDRVQRLMREEAIDCHLHCQSSHVGTKSCAIKCGGEDDEVQNLEEDDIKVLTEEHVLFLLTMEEYESLLERIGEETLITETEEKVKSKYVLGYQPEILQQIIFINLFDHIIKTKEKEDSDEEDEFDEKFVEKYPVCFFSLFVTV